MIEPRTGPEAEERAYQEAVIEDRSAGPMGDDLDVAATPAETVGESEPAAPPERDQWEEAGAVTGADAAAALGPEPASEWLGGGERVQRVRALLRAGAVRGAEPARARGWCGCCCWSRRWPPPSGSSRRMRLRARLGLAGASGTPLQLMVTNSDRQTAGQRQ